MRVSCPCILVVCETTQEQSMTTQRLTAEKERREHAEKTKNIQNITNMTNIRSAEEHNTIISVKTFLI